MCCQFNKYYNKMSEAYIQQQVQKIMLHNKIHLIIKKIREEQTAAQMQESKPKEEQQISKPEISFQQNQGELNLPEANLEEGEIRNSEGEQFRVIAKPEEITIPVQKK